MANKLLVILLMSIVTKKGDGGETLLASGGRVSKADARVDAYGTLDELVSFLGLARSLARDKDTAGHIKKIQGDLFMLGSELAMGDAAIAEKHLKLIDELVEKYEPQLGKLTTFVIPGDSPGSAALDVARTVCRRLERKVVALTKAGELKNKTALKYLNRLSDLLFVFARHV